MTSPPGGVPVTGPASALLSSSFITEFAYLTPRGEPLCWPVTPYWYPERGVLGIATGLAYPNKAHYARRHPRVSALFRGRGMQVLLQGDAVVLDEDLQANTDRYVREMRSRFLSAWLGLNPLSVKLLDFYLPRLWIEITPVRILEGPPGPQAQEPSESGALPGPALAPGPERHALDQWVRRGDDGVVALAGPGGYPSVACTGASMGPEGSILLERAPGVGPATLTFHSQSLGGVRLDALMARGWVVRSAGGPRFVPRRVVGFLGRDAGSRAPFMNIFPLSQLPRAAALRTTLSRELARRGEVLPRLRVPR